MSDDNTQEGAEPSPASAGSRPVAWGAVASDGSVVCMMRRRADVASYVVDGTPIVPLYRQPPLTLTDVQRQAIEAGVKALRPRHTWRPDTVETVCADADKQAAVLREMLERAEGGK